MLWRSEDTVVFGKQQDALAEINFPFVCRIFGGGTVFHNCKLMNL